MNPPCASCKKTVYPTEKLNCLDKIWHKSCFKCQKCHMTLNMKNYKGYEKMPYCNAHYPTTKHTQVADTPESRRIAENTKIQSNIQYHSEFERMKGSYTVCPDNPELQRHLQNSVNISLREYHEAYERGKAKYTSVADRADLKHHQDNKKNVSKLTYTREFEKAKGKYTSLPDCVELQHHRQNKKNVSLVAYHKEFEKGKAKYSSVVDSPEMLLHKQNRRLSSSLEYTKDFKKSKGKFTAVADSPEMMQHQQNRRMSSSVSYTSEHQKTKSKYTPVPDLEMERQLAMRPKKKPKPRIKYHEDFERQKGKKMSVADDPETLRLAQNQMTASQISYKGIIDQKEFQESVRPQSQINEEMQRRHNPGKISEYQPPDPAPYQGRPPSSGLAYDSRSGQDDEFSGADEFQNGGGRRRQPGSITDYDPENDKWGSLTGQAPAPQRYAPAPAPAQNYPPPQQQQPAYQPPPPQAQPPRAAAPSTKGMMCKAIYDYTAADTDEVGFVEDDIIVYCQAVDEGWMMGTVERTGQRGMLPSNYVERIN